MKHPVRAAFARLGSYYELLARLKACAVPTSIAPKSAYFPEGEDWGAPQNVGVSDVMLPLTSSLLPATARLTSHHWL